MAQHRSAEKRHRQSLKRRVRNRALKTRVRNAITRVRAAATAESDDRTERFKEAEQLLRRAVSKGAMHQKTVSRTVSRLHRLITR